MQCYGSKVCHYSKSFRSDWNTNRKWIDIAKEKTKPHTLLYLAIRAFYWEILACVIPRLSYVGLVISQPYLIRRAVKLFALPHSDNARGRGILLIAAFALVYGGMGVGMFLQIMNEVVTNSWYFDTIDNTGSIKAQSRPAHRNDAKCFDNNDIRSIIAPTGIARPRPRNHCHQYRHRTDLSWSPGILRMLGSAN